MSLQNARVSQAFDAVTAAVQHTGSVQWTYGDESRFSVDFPGGSLIELLNDIVRSHGRLSWSITSHKGTQQIDDSTAVETVEPFIGLGGISFPLVQDSRQP